MIERIIPLSTPKPLEKSKVTMIKAMVQQQETANVSIAVGLGTKRRTVESLCGGPVKRRSEDQKRENATNAEGKGIFRETVQRR